MTQYISIIGSTGSIGRQTLDVINSHPDKWSVSVLATYKNIDLLEEQIYKYKPEVASVYDEKQSEILKKRLKPCETAILGGMEGWIQAAIYPKAEKIVFSTTGVTALEALYEAIKQRKQILLANKEMIVAKGEIIMDMAQKNEVSIIPIDSEHSAVFQCLQGENPANIEKIILTCSGGPFLGKTTAELENITAKEALNHPKWDMGDKITIDSATLMNKGFEIIEAKHLFGISEDQIEVVIHPECIIHSMVQFKDGSVKAQLGMPDMRIPITYALSYPERIHTGWPRMDFAEISGLTFIKSDFSVFRGPRLAHTAIKKGGETPAKLRKANDEAVQKFLNNEIPFLEIYKEIEKAI